MKRLLALIIVVLTLNHVGVHAAGSTSSLQKREPMNDPTLKGTAPYIPVSSQTFTIGSTDFYYLEWKTSYNAGEKLDVILVTNPGTTPPTVINVNISDEYGKVKLVDLGGQKPNGKAGTPYTLTSYTIPAKIPAPFDFTSGYFNVVLSWTEGGKNYVKDRRIKINKVVADPGGQTNPALANASKSPDATNGGASDGGGSGGGSSGGSDGNGSGKKSAASASIPSMTSKGLFGVFIIHLITIWFS